MDAASAVTAPAWPAQIYACLKQNAVKTPPNLTLVVLDNGHFGETGMQLSHSGHGIDLAAVALSAGFASVSQRSTVPRASPPHGTRCNPRRRRPGCCECGLRRAKRRARCRRVTAFSSNTVSGAVLDTRWRLAGAGHSTKGARHGGLGMQGGRVE